MSTTFKVPIGIRLQFDLAIFTPQVIIVEAGEDETIVTIRPQEATEARVCDSFDFDASLMGQSDAS